MRCPPVICQDCVQPSVALCSQVIALFLLSMGGFIQKWFFYWYSKTESRDAFSCKCSKVSALFCCGFIKLLLHEETQQVTIFGNLFTSDCLHIWQFWCKVGQAGVTKCKLWIPQTMPVIKYAIRVILPIMPTVYNTSKRSVSNVSLFDCSCIWI